MDKELMLAANPLVAEQIKQAKITNDKLDKLIKILDGATDPKGDGLYATQLGIKQILDCTKKGNNTHRANAFYITVGFAITALFADYFIKGETSHIFTVIKLFSGVS